MKTREWLVSLILLAMVMAILSCSGPQSPQDSSEDPSGDSSNDPPESSFIGVVLDVNRNTDFPVADAEFTDAMGTTVVFSVVQVDEFDSYDASTGVYTVPQDGDYDVSYGIEIEATAGAGHIINYNVNVESSSGTTTSSDPTVATDASGVYAPALRVSRS